MGLEIYYTTNASLTLNNTYQFILGKFGVRVAEKFLSKVDRTMSLIAEHPLMFKASSIDDNVRIALISKQTSLFYRVTGNSIDLLFFWDNRQDPILPLY